MKRNIIFVLVILLSAFLSNKLYAQEVLWEKGFGTGDYTDVNSLHVANKKNDILIAGRYSSDILNLGQIQLPKPTGAEDGFLAMLDSAGNALWAFSLQATKDGDLRVAGLDSLGNIYVFGIFQNRVTLGTTTIAMPQESDFGCFLAKFNQQGELFWATQLEGDPVTHAMATDKNGNTYVSLPVRQPDGYNVLLYKYNTEGKKEWGTKIGRSSPGLLYPASIKFDHLQRPVIAFNPIGLTMVNDQLIGGSEPKDIDLVLVKVSRDGAFLWYKKNDPPLPDAWRTLIVDGNDNISVVGGNYSNDAGAFSNELLATYDSLGNRISLVKPEGVFSGFDLTNDGLGNFYIIGNFQKQMKWGNQILHSDSWAIFIVKLTSQGSPVWAIQNNNPKQSDAGLFIARASDGSLFVAGRFNGSISFGNKTLKMDDNNLLHIYLIKIKDNTPSKIDLELGADIGVCDTPVRFGQQGFARYRWQDGSTDSSFTTTEPGLYYVSATDHAGWVQTDSIRVIDCIDGRIPNVITPGSDDKNEFFVIKEIDISANNTLMIYNRWGNEVFRSAPYKNDWNGSGLSAGVYYYVFREERTKHISKGCVQIIR